MPFVVLYVFNWKIVINILTQNKNENIWQIISESSIYDVRWGTHRIESIALSLGMNLFHPELSECTELDSFPCFSDYPEADCKSVFIFLCFVDILEILEFLDEIFKNNVMPT